MTYKKKMDLGTAKSNRLEWLHGAAPPRRVDVVLDSAADRKLARLAIPPGRAHLRSGAPVLRRVRASVWTAAWSCCCFSLGCLFVTVYAFAYTFRHPPGLDQGALAAGPAGWLPALGLGHLGPGPGPAPSCRLQ